MQNSVVYLCVRLKFLSVAPHPIDVDIRAVILRHSATTGRLWALRSVTGTVFAEPTGAVVVDPEGYIVEGQRIVNRERGEATLQCRIHHFKRKTSSFWIQNSSF